VLRFFGYRLMDWDAGLGFLFRLWLLLFVVGLLAWWLSIDGLWSEYLLAGLVFLSCVMVLFGGWISGHRHHCGVVSCFVLLSTLFLALGVYLPLEGGLIEWWISLFS